MSNDMIDSYLKNTVFVLVDGRKDVVAGWFGSYGRLVTYTEYGYFTR